MFRAEALNEIGLSQRVYPSIPPCLITEARAYRRGAGLLCFVALSHIFEA
jgi:hypothetical protein